MKIRFLLLFSVLAGFTLHAQQKAYYRTPALYDHWVVFTAEGDLWKHDLTTQQTVRLTSHHGVESEAAFSPDGKTLVFAGEYEGPTELYSIPSDGGVPRRLTYENNRGIRPIRWTSDGKILYTSTSFSTLLDNQLVKLNPADLTYELVPLAQADDGDYSDDKTLFFTRFSFQGSQTKRYKGGTAQNIWKFSGNAASSCLTCDYTGTSRQAMVYKDRIYFASDRDGTMNIWSMNQDGKDLKQQTFSSGWDIQSPAIDHSRIVYQKGADLWLYDIETNKDQLLDIRVHSDFDQRRPRWIKNPEELISDWEISPTGKLVAMIARGRIFVSPAKGGRWIEVSKKSGTRYKDVQFLDDKNIIYTSDESGEVEIWKTSSDGSGTPQRLTQNSKVLITRVTASPDGKWIAWSDKDLKLTVMNAATLIPKLVEQNEYNEIYSISWSKDSQYLFYASNGENQNDAIKAYTLATGQKERITTDRTNSYDAQTSVDQQWLFFTSEREFKSTVGSPWGPRQPEPYFDKVAKVYALALQVNAEFPFVQADTWKDSKEESKKDEVKKDDGTVRKAEPKKPIPIAAPIDWAAAAGRLYEVPLPGKNLIALRASETHLYWGEMEAGQWNAVKVFSLKIGYEKKAEPTLVAEAISGFDLSADRKKIIISKNNSLYISDANGEKVDFEKTKVDLSQWSFQFDPVDDWKQMFSDAWRLERDYFYDRNLHGLDWPAIKKRYEPLVERVADRRDLDDLMAQMVAELSALHTFVYGGDKRRSPDNIQPGSLGARLEKDPASGAYVIKHIYKSDPEYPQAQSPLNRPQLKIKEGDTILKIDGVSVADPGHLTQLLANKVSVPVKLTLKNAGGTYEQLVTPIAADQETNLRYGEWEYTRRLEVEKKGQAQIGYIHLRAMGEADIADFAKNFYPVFNRSGLVLDVRHNAGGNIDSWIIEKLMRKAWFYWQGRVGKPTWNMQYAFRGHLVVLCDENTGSDGEAVTEGIRRLGLGTVIGTRTWGGEIWLSSSNRLVDNGVATAAETGVYDEKGNWLIEGHGVDPDQVVDNEPFETFNGKDAQLDAAIKFLLDKIAKEPVTVPKAPPYPNKQFKYKD